jgi:hypothetical protein
MKLLINNTILDGEYDEDGKLFMPLNNISDILFFKEWENKTKNRNK